MTAHGSVIAGPSIFFSSRTEFRVDVPGPATAPTVTVAARWTGARHDKLRIRAAF